MSDRRIDWGRPAQELLARLVEVASGWADGDSRAQAIAKGIIDRICKEDRERLAVLLETHDPSSLGIEREMSLSGATRNPIEYDGIDEELVAAWIRRGGQKHQKVDKQ